MVHHNHKEKQDCEKLGRFLFCKIENITKKKSFIMSPSSGTLFYNILLFHHWVLLTKIRKILPSYPVDKINNLNKIFSLFLVVRNISGSSILPSHGKCTVHYWNYSWDTPRINPLVLIEIVNFSWRCKKVKESEKKRRKIFSRTQIEVSYFIAQFKKSWNLMNVLHNYIVLHINCL